MNKFLTLASGMLLGNAVNGQMFVTDPELADQYQPQLLDDESFSKLIHDIHAGKAT